ncbi:hypothetical protein [Clostridium kluyveri]|uniref:Uncharacterized protein n=1 Tax=Clostridium kluyveri TaxID=1534 RepID=A0A1L5FEH8_CLOKL|nr:hypothetical protein BS101_22085 [Clostridium kluyveri]
MFLSMALISVLAKPIVFREKWQGGVGYGLPSALYLLLFFLMFFSEYDIVQTTKASSNNGVSQVSAQGPVTAVEPKSVTKSVFQEIPIKEVEKLPIQEISATSSTGNSNNAQYVDASGNGLIKGNTSKTTGEKIYHIPGSTYYDSTKIEDTEVWFKTVEEAETAGYRAPKR